MRQVEADSVKPGIVDRFLSLFATVQPGEGVTALLLMVNVFTLLTAYYIIKPVREALILGEAGAVVKSYASAGQAGLLLLIVPLYGMLGSRLSRVWLINGVLAFFVSNLAIFYVLGQAGVSLGVVFYLWVGLFNVMLVAQFWAFANDIYTQKKGERLFGVVGIGASLGAILGAWLAGVMFEPIGAYSMMLVTASMLGLSMIFTNWIHRREAHTTAIRPASQPAAAENKLGSQGGFQLIFKSRYLLLVAFLVLISNFVNTTGEFILGKTVEETAQAATAGVADPEAAQGNYIGQFYANFYFWVNLIGALLQMFVVSRLMQMWGAGVALFFLPVIAFGGYMMLALVPILSLIRIAKIAENTLDYSVQNTARHALFLSTSREAKYKAKAAIDSFFWRTGDALSALLVFVGTQLLALSPRGFAAVNVVFVVVWLGIAYAIVRETKAGKTASRTAA
ncbi:MAG TPA: Npt1/Npt2 family nucleotide transporter [Terriglobia bacterium]|nr:Npt1/Npt2 family nucleotide transporter [Terriglobia bacterium]